MPVHDVNVVVCDQAGAHYGEISHAQIDEIVWGLNNVGDKLSFTHSTNDPFNRSFSALFVEGRELQVWIDGLCQWGGYLGTADGGSETTKVECVGLSEYFKGRFVTNTSLQYSSLDQFTIGWNLISYAQADQPGDPAGMRNLGFSSSYSPSGYIRSRLYSRDQHPCILDQLLEFPKIKNGYDWSFAWSTDGVQRLWTPYYPKRGVTQTNLVLEWGRNITNFKYKIDRLKLANEVWYTGGSNAGVKFENHYLDTVAAQSSKLFQAVKSDGKQNDVNQLLLLAQREVELRKVPVITPEITSIDVPVTLLGQIQVGDTIYLNINWGWIQLSLSPFRINTITFRPATTEITLGLSQYVAP